MAHTDMSLTFMITYTLQMLRKFWKFD